MDEVDLDQIYKESEESRLRFERIEEEGVRETIKYFDRIHDKLTNINNILVAAYLALVAIKPHVSKAIILVPIINLIFLIYVDWRMMEKSRMQSNITKLSENELKKYGSIINNTNLYSFALICTTIFVTVFFLLKL